MLPVAEGSSGRVLQCFQIIMEFVQYKSSVSHQCLFRVMGDDAGTAKSCKNLSAYPDQISCKGAWAATWRRLLKASQCAGIHPMGIQQMYSMCLPALPWMTSSSLARR